MIVKPKVREFICTTAHPLGCRESVRLQKEEAEKRGKLRGPKKVLVIGSSTGYGLASRIMSAFGCKAATLGVMFERAASGKRTATPGWYNTWAFEEFAGQEGLYAKTLNADAFLKETKEEIVKIIKEDLGKVDLVVYSLAAPRRTMPDGSVSVSVLRTTDTAFTEKNLDLRSNEVNQKTVEAASAEEIQGTIDVMGGGDWKDWIDALKEADVLEENAVTVAYSYIGPKLTYPIYYNGTIGMAKKDLHRSQKEISEKYSDVKAYVSVNKALVTQASSAIPVVPLYFAILYKVMKEKGSHEGCIEQICRLFHDKLYIDKPMTDEEGLIRMDDWELEEDVQARVEEIWKKVDSDNVKEVADIEGYWQDFYRMFGFSYDTIDYEEDTDIEKSIAGID